MSYAVIRSDKANEQLNELIEYIVQDSGSVDIALKYLDGLEKSIDLLKTMPYLGSLPRYSALRKKGYRVLIVERSLVFYKVNESVETVTIYAVVDARQKYIDLI